MKRSILGMILCALCLLAPLVDVMAMASPPAETPKPNIVLIVADDLGYSDLGVFGGEIDTPNIDRLAQRGTLLTNFHVAPSCSPTRSMLLTGTDNHTAGIGAMAESTPDSMKQQFGYEGQITERVATIAERFAAAGYATLMAGKWHLGMAPDSVPSARGFAQSYSLLEGAHNHFGQGGFGPAGSKYASATYLKDGRPVEVSQPFYSSDAFTTELLDQIDAVPVGQAFFAYLAFTAPHSPLQAPASVIEKYRGRYDAGWAELMRSRSEKLASLGIINATIPAAMIAEAEAAWHKLSIAERNVEARKMEVYAAMVDQLDFNVGRLQDEISARGLAQNTIFVFLSDNGPAGETAEIFGVMPGVIDYINSFDTSIEAMGSADSFVFYGRHWAQAASAPLARYKAFVTEGGTRVPAFITLPDGYQQIGASNSLTHVMDIVPTLLELSAIDASNQLGERVVAPIRGKSLQALIEGRVKTARASNEAIAFELHRQRSVYQGDWKLRLIPEFWGGSGQWQLFRLDRDPRELNDLSERYPDQRAAMIELWLEYAATVKIPVS